MRMQNTPRLLMNLLLTAAGFLVLTSMTQTVHASDSSDELCTIYKEMTFLSQTLTPDVETENKEIIVKYILELEDLLKSERKSDCVNIGLIMGVYESMEYYLPEISEHFLEQLIATQYNDEFVSTYIDFLLANQGSAYEGYSFIFFDLFNISPELVLTLIARKTETNQEFLLDKIVWGILNRNISENDEMILGGEKYVMKIIDNRIDEEEFQKQIQFMGTSIDKYWDWAEEKTSVKNNPKNTEINVITKDVFIAPIFQHGEGRNCFGCCWGQGYKAGMAEFTGREIIESKLLERGISFPEHDYIIQKIQINQICDAMMAFGRGKPVEVIQGDKIIGTKPFVLDGYNKDLNLGYEYISMEDFIDLGGYNAGYFHELDYEWAPDGHITQEDVMECGTFVGQGFDLISVSDNLRKQLIKYNGINVILFYDPMPEMDENVKVSTKRRLKAITDQIQSKYDESQLEYRQSMQLAELEIYSNVDSAQAISLFLLQIVDSLEWLRSNKLLAN